MVKLSIQNEKCPTEQIKVRFVPLHKNKTNQPINYQQINLQINLSTYFIASLAGVRYWNN